MVWAPIAICGWFLDCAFFGWILVRGAPFLGWILVRGMWCADFWGRFRCTVRRFWARFWCAVHRFWARFWCAVCGVPILGPWCTAHGFTRCWCRRCTLRLRAQCPVWVFFGARCAFLGCFWCAVRRFWAPFWCTVCGAPLLGPISVHGAPFWVRFWCVAF